MKASKRVLMVLLGLLAAGAVGCVSAPVNPAGGAAAGGISAPVGSGLLDLRGPNGEQIIGFDFVRCIFIIETGLPSGDTGGTRPPPADGGINTRPPQNGPLPGVSI